MALIEDRQTLYDNIIQIFEPAEEGNSFNRLHRLFIFASSGYVAESVWSELFDIRARPFMKNAPLSS